MREMRHITQEATNPIGRTTSDSIFVAFSFKLGMMKDRAARERIMEEFERRGEDLRYAAEFLTGKDGS